MAEDTPIKQQLKIRYTDTSALYASQFILNTSEEDITINFSSGPMADPASGETTLPIHTRISVTKNGARRLAGILAKVLAEQDEKEKIEAAAQVQMPKLQQ